MKHALKTIIYLISISFATNALSDNMVQLQNELLTFQINFREGDLKNKDYVKTIIREMSNMDQKIRKLFPKYINNHQFIKLMRENDKFNTNKLKEILHQHYWTTISKFGVETDNQAWLLVQHADHDPFFQAGCLFILSNLVNKGETSKANYAYLYDRVVTKFNKKQKYGTQALIINGEMKLLPYEGNVKELNQRRQQMGLGTIEEYIK